MKEQDVVFREAFKVVKDDFKSRLLDSDSIKVALGVTTHQEVEEEGKILAGIDQESETIVEAFTKILDRSPTLNDFVCQMRVYILVKEEQYKKAKRREKEMLRMIDGMRGDAPPEIKHLLDGLKEDLK